MGNRASKLSRTSGRVLQNSNSRAAAPAAMPARSTRPSQAEKLAEPEQKPGPTVAERLMKLGQVQVTEASQQYKPSSEDKFTLTLEARQRLENDYNQAQEQEPDQLHRQHVPAVTITAILDSLREGDSPDRVIKAYKLDPAVLDYLRAISLPEIPKQNLPNELLQNPEAQREPVRRKREPVQ